MRKMVMGVLLLSLLTVSPIVSQEPELLAESAANIAVLTAQMPATSRVCEDAYFSTEEDFITQGPLPPDGSPVISDGDLLGPGCAVFARNRELLAAFKVERDLGLDAADVIDLERRLVAFSTELDDERGMFTAGDLLSTNGAIIPNTALLARFDIPRADLGLDAVHFVGRPELIVGFLDQAARMSPDDWMENPEMLSEMLKEHGIDIWFSTEGTAPKPEDPLFLDGDLLSARDGIIVARNALLLPPTVPAGIPDRGVDFGLDAVTADRAGNRRLIHFSTEILYEERFSFTDGDVLRLGNGVVCANEDLIICFEPKADELGLDALSIVTKAEILEIPPCLAEIIKVGGMPSGNVNPDGLANGESATTPTFDAFDGPFGGVVEIIGRMPSCEECVKFKVEYAEWPNPTTPPADSDFQPLTDDFKEWIFIPWGGGMYIRVDRMPDTDGWLDILCDTIMGGLYYPWDTSGKNGKYSLRLTIEDVGGVQQVSSPVVVMIDNTVPKAVLTIDTTPTCGDIFVGDLVTGKITATDEHFYSYKLRYESSLASGLIFPVEKYSGPGDQGDVDRPFEWDTTGLPACGYRIVLEVWDRTIVNNRRTWGEPGYAHRVVNQTYFCLEETAE